MSTRRCSPRHGVGAALRRAGAEVTGGVARLIRRGVVVETAVEGWPGRWLVTAAAIR